MATKYKAGKKAVVLGRFRHNGSRYAPEGLAREGERTDCEDHTPAMFEGDDPLLVFPEDIDKNSPEEFKATLGWRREVEKVEAERDALAAELDSTQKALRQSQANLAAAAKEIDELKAAKGKGSADDKAGK